MNIQNQKDKHSNLSQIQSQQTSQTQMPNIRNVYQQVSNGLHTYQHFESTTNEFAATSQHFEPTTNHHISSVNFSNSPQQSTLKTNLGNVLDDEIRRIVSEMVKNTNKKQDLNFITTCKIWNQLHENKQILNNLSNFNVQKHQSDLKNVMDKFDILEKQNFDSKNLVEVLIKQQEQNIKHIMDHFEIAFEQSLKSIAQQNIEHKKSLGILITQQQNLKQNLNNKINSLTNKLSNIQMELKQSASKQRTILSNIMSKKNIKEQQRSPIKQLHTVEENELKTEVKIHLKTNKLLKNMQHQQKLFESSLEKLNKKLDDQTNKLIYNNNFGINNLLKQTKMIKNTLKNGKHCVSHQIDNTNNVKNMQKILKSNVIIGSNNNKMNLKEDTLANKIIQNQQLLIEKINSVQIKQNQMDVINKEHADANQHQYMQKQQFLQQQQQQLYQQQNINQNNIQFQNINQIHDNLQNYKSQRIDMVNFMNEAVKTLKTANAAITTIAND